MEKLLLSMGEAAEVLELSRAYLYRLIEDETHPLPSIKIGRSRRIPAADLRRWVAERAAEGREV